MLFNTEKSLTRVTWHPFPQELYPLQAYSVILACFSAVIVEKVITSSVLGNRVKVAQDMPRGLGSMASPEVQAGSYETPTASELHRLMWTKKGGNNRMDEVYPRIYIGDMWELTTCLICICYEWCNNESSKIIHRISQSIYFQICSFIILWHLWLLLEVFRQERVRERRGHTSCKGHEVASRTPDSCKNFA